MLCQEKKGLCNIGVVAVSRDLVGRAKVVRLAMSREGVGCARVKKWFPYPEEESELTRWE
jgi:hypothetical protein